MTISDSMNNGGGGGTLGTTQNKEDDIASRLNQFEELCNTLGIPYKQRLKELGINPYQEVDAEGCKSLAETMGTLSRIKESRFRELQKCRKGLIGLWRTGTRALSKTISLDQLYAVADAKSSKEINSEKLLSTKWLSQVDAEKERFENAEMEKLKAKYQERNKQLSNFVKLSHLTHSEVEFDPSAPVDPKLYKEKVKAIKKSVKLAKRAFAFRREMVYRVELIQRAISRGADLTSIDALIVRAKEAVGELIKEPSTKVPSFDGLDAYVHLANLWSVAVSLNQDIPEKLKTNNEAVDLVADLKRNNKAPVTRARSGLGSATHDVSSKLNVPSSNSEDLQNWTAKDTKKMIGLVFNVTDLKRAVKCYTECFGMTLLEETREDDCSHACLGYGPKGKNTMLRLNYNPADVKNMHVGEGFGHVSIANDDVLNLAKAVQASSFLKVAHKPCRLPGCSVMIAFVVDPCGILFELVQSNHPNEEPITRVMLYVDDIDRSIRFYEKALGMRVLKKSNEETCKIVFLGYNEETKETLLELRCSDITKDCDHGTAFTQIIIGTLDVGKSFETLKALLEDEDEDAGGEILQEPSGDIRRCSFLDPDGWKYVLVDYDDDQPM